MFLPYWKHGKHLLQKGLHRHSPFLFSNWNSESDVVAGVPQIVVYAVVADTVEADAPDLDGFDGSPLGLEGVFLAATKFVNILISTVHIDNLSWTKKSVAIQMY